MLRKHFNATTIIAIVALVFAMTGGAFAVSSKGGSGNATAVAAKKKKGKAKPKVKLIPGPKGATGPAGPAGAQGPAGPAGPTGPEGKQGGEGKEGKEGKQGIQGKEGKQGIQGEEGESVTVTSLSKGNTNCKEGGAEVTNKSGTAYACNGVAGAGGGGGPLQKGETETGVFGGEATALIAAEEEYIGYAPITFARPLEKALSGGFRVIYPGESSTTECPGNTGKPEAKEGYVCLYVNVVKNSAKIGAAANTLYGVVASVHLPESAGPVGAAQGVWAVTAS
jgi:Collagen triple helix repeat (20 copies)